MGVGVGGGVGVRVPGLGGCGLPGGPPGGEPIVGRPGGGSCAGVPDGSPSGPGPGSGAAPSFPPGSLPGGDPGGDPDVAGTPVGEEGIWDGTAGAGAPLGVPVTPRGCVVVLSRMGSTLSGESWGSPCQGSRMPGGSPVGGNAAVATPVTPPFSLPIRSKITAIATTVAIAASVPATA